MQRKGIGSPSVLDGSESEDTNVNQERHIGQDRAEDVRLSWPVQGVNKTRGVVDNEKNECNILHQLNTFKD